VNSRLETFSATTRSNRVSRALYTCRGRDSRFWLPPARTRACAASAHGSYLGYLAYLASKRTLG
jgi:hypothetical protein